MLNGRWQIKSNLRAQNRSGFCLFLFLGKDARLYVFRLTTMKRGLEEKQLVRGKCDSRENKLEKTKGITRGVDKLTPTARWFDSAQFLFLSPHYVHSNRFCLLLVLLLFALATYLPTLPFSFQGPLFPCMLLIYDKCSLFSYHNLSLALNRLRLHVAV